MKDKLRELLGELMSACEMIGYATSGNERASHRSTRDQVKAELLALIDAEGDGGAVAWQIETDDDVERVAKESGWDNRRYMTPADYSIWCIRMREFVRIAVDVPQPFTTHPARSGVVSDEDVDRIIASVRHVNTDGMDGDSWDRILVRAAIKGERHER